jgi:hypothetical protein
MVALLTRHQLHKMKGLPGRIESRVAKRVDEMLMRCLDQYTAGIDRVALERIMTPCPFVCRSNQMMTLASVAGFAVARCMLHSGYWTMEHLHCRPVVGLISR